MRIARCTLDNIAYTAVDFNKTDDFVNKRRNLICPQCNVPAFYRGISQNGREACFGARHSDGCDLATMEHDGTTAGQGGIDDEIMTTGQRIVVDFNFGTTVTDYEAQPAGGQADTGNEGALRGEGPTLEDHSNTLELVLYLLKSNKSPLYD